MTILGFPPPAWPARHRAIRGAFAVSLALAIGASCAQQSGDTGVGSGTTGGGATSSSVTTTTTNTSTTTTTTTSSSGGGAGGAGGAGTTSTSSSSASSTTSSSSAASGGSSSAGGGGAGGSFVAPLGTQDYPAETEQNNLPSTANPLPPGAKGFTASIWPEGDVDVFSFQVVTPGTSLSVWTGDGMGGCPAGAKTLLRVLDSTGAVLGTSTNGGPAGCSRLNPGTDPALVSIAPGTYYVHVEADAIETIPFYIVGIDVQAPACGDGIVQVPNGEQCDLGSSNGGAQSGCSATCQLESGHFIFETEPNNTQATGNSLDGADGVVAQIEPVGDVDFFTFDVTVAGSSVYAETGDGFSACPANFDSIIYLFDPSGSQIAFDDDGGVVPCSKISAAQYPAAANLAVGTYAIEVVRYGNNVAAPWYVMKFKLTPPSCGDGIVEAGEQCDIGAMNGVAASGCSATCMFTANYIPETEPNDTQALANPLGSAAGFIASIEPIGDLDYFSFVVTVPGSSVTIETSDGLNGCPPGFDSLLYLYDPSHSQIAMDHGDGVAPCSKIWPGLYAAATNLAPGTYYTRVERNGDNAVQPEYVVKITVTPPGCGDDVVETGEQCDLGAANGMAGGVCTATCTSLSPFEIEPNNSVEQANPLWPGTSMWEGSINPIGDHDYFTFTLPLGMAPTLVTHAVGNPAVCGFDTVIYLLDAAGNLIVSDDDGGVSPCSQISPTLYPQVQNLAPGAYYVWVQHFQDSQTIPLYELDLTIQ
jgi:cysteine-rich repeat protein